MLTMQRELHASQSQEQWFVDDYTLVFAALLFTGGVRFTDPLSYGGIVVGTVILAVFVVVERRADNPSLDISLFRYPAFSAACAALTMAFFALFGVTFFLTFYLQFVRTYSPFEAGLCFIPVAVALAVFAPRSDRLVRRFGAKAVCGVALLVVGGAFGIYSVMDARTSIWWVEAVLFLQGVGMANVVAPATNSLLSVVPLAKAGAGAAVNNTVRQVGGALGVAIVGSVLAGTYGSHLGSALDRLPQNARAVAEQSIDATLAVAKHAPASVRDRLVTRADAAYVDAMHDAAYVSAGAALVGALAVVGWLPGRGSGGGEPYPVSPGRARGRGGSRPARRRRGRRAPAKRS